MGGAARGEGGDVPQTEAMIHKRFVAFLPQSHLFRACRRYETRIPILELVESIQYVSWCLSTGYLEKISPSVLLAWYWV